MPDRPTESMFVSLLCTLSLTQLNLHQIVQLYNDLSKIFGAEEFDALIEKAYKSSQRGFDSKELE